MRRGGQLEGLLLSIPVMAFYAITIWAGAAGLIWAVDYFKKHPIQLERCCNACANSRLY